MDKYYIKEGDTWLGPLSEIEFEFRKSGMDSFEYWKPEFCENHILHPSLCSHTKTWMKPQQHDEQKTIEKKAESKAPETVQEKPAIKNDVIISAKPLDPDEEELVEKPGPESEKEQQPQQQVTDTGRHPREAGILFKIIVIIIGFVLVLGAGYYVNSKLSVLFYQDVIIQESVRNMEYYTRDMVDETKAIKSEIDSLNARIDKQYRSLSKELNNIKLKLQETENQ